MKPMARSRTASTGWARSSCSWRRGWRCARAPPPAHAGPLLKYAHTPSDPGTVLTTTGPYYGAGNYGQVGARAVFELDTRDHTAAPARGLHVTFAGQWYPAVWDVASPFGSLSAEASTYLSAGDPPDATLALRAGGAAVSGTVPFQELVLLGGGTTVRGYPEQRFAAAAAPMRTPSCGSWPAACRSAISASSGSGRGAGLDPGGVVRPLARRRRGRTLARLAAPP